MLWCQVVSMREAGPVWGHQGWPGRDKLGGWEEGLSWGWGWDSGEEMAQRDLGDRKEGLGTDELD